MRRPITVALAAVCLAACSPAPSAVAPTPSAATADSSPSASASAAPGDPAVMNPAPSPAAAAGAGCGDPTAHVYHAYRLQLIDRCRTVTGIIAGVRAEADGDYHVRLTVDPQFSGMIRPANNSGEHGDLVLEPICQHAVTQADAVGPCQGGVPLVPIPPVGTHVSATGTYVLDTAHGGWAELHPLFEIHAG